MKYFRTYHFPFSPGTTSDDRISDNYDFLIGREIVISEKLDGQNNALTKNGVFARSHAVPTEHPWDKYLIDEHKKMIIPEDTIIYGESMYAIHSIEYKNLPSYYNIFSVLEEDTFLSWDDVKITSDIIGYPTVPVLFEGILSSPEDLKKKVTELVSKTSVYNSYRNGVASNMEGVVVRLREKFRVSNSDVSILKWVCEKHVNTDDHWTRNWKKAKIIF
jgi:hypothetical protein